MPSFNYDEEVTPGWRPKEPTTLTITVHGPEQA
jgi:hypothetical protein